MHQNHLLKFTSLKTARRLQAVLRVFFKYGLGEITELIGLSKLLHRRCREEACEVAQEMTIWEKLRHVIEDLGATTIKIGQLLSMRPDLVPQEFCVELQNLQEEAPPVPFEEIKREVETSLRKPLAQVFDYFERKPIASASLSQVHKAVLKETGETVAVKVKRPHVEDTIEADLEVMAYLASLAHDRVFSLKPANLPDVVSEVRKGLTRELNFRNEARNAALFNQKFADDPTVRAPEPIPAYCTEDVIVMEYIQGVRLDRFQGSHERREQIAQRGLDLVVEQILEHGFFHADPHLGNLKIDENDAIILYDWGMVGRFTEEMRAAIVDYIIAVVKLDSKRAARVALEMATKVPPNLDFQRFQTDVIFALEKVHTPVDHGLNLGVFLLDLTNLCRGYGVYLRSDYILMARALLATESAGRTICPDFDTVGALKPVALKYIVKRYSLLFSDKDYLGDVEDMGRLLARIPKRLDKVLHIMESGEFTLEMRQADFHRMVQSMGSIADRIATGLIVASLIVGSSLVFNSNIGPKLWGLPLFGLVGFSLSGLFGAWLLLRMVIRRK